jgi:hypothetical protein
MESEDFLSIGIGRSGDESSRLDFTFSLDWIDSDKVKCDVFEHGQVVGCGLGSDSHLIVVESDVHGRAQAVFDRPVGADCVGGLSSIGSHAADVGALFAGGVFPDGAFRLECRKAA